MALASEGKPFSSGYLDRCFNGTPKIHLDLDHISRLASLGLPRRVPCSIPAEDADGKNESPLSKVSDGINHNRESSIDSSEARKRKAERDAPSMRDRSQVRQTDGRSYPNARSNFDLAADVRNRKAIDLAKEALCIQDKENINPCCAYNPEPKMPVSDRSGEKRRFQVSNKLQNVLPSRKVGSLLVKQTLKSRVRAPLYDASQRPTTPQSATLLKEQPQQQDSSRDSVASAGADEPINCIHSEQINNDSSAPGDSMSISQPLQFMPLSYDIPKQKSEQEGKWLEDGRCKPSVNNYIEMRGSRASSNILESEQDGLVMKSLKELSSFMNGLAIVDTHIEISPVEGKDQLKREIHKHLHGSFITDTKHSVPDCQASISAGCSSLPVGPSSSTACSITIRTTSAPLTHSFTDENVQALSPKTEQSPETFSPNPADREEMPSQVNYEFRPCQRSIRRDERECPEKVAENVMIHSGQPQDDVPSCDAGVGKVILNQQLPEKNAGHPPKRQVEHEHFVVINGKKYQKLKKIGRGGSSEVFKVIDRESNIYALKRIKLKGRDYATASGFYQEIELLTRLQGKKYIIRLIDHEVTDKNLFSGDVDGSSIIKHDAYLYMVLEFGEVDLATMLQEKWKERTESNNAIDETWLRFYWKQILEAVNTVHEERIIHADLKPANFLLVKGVLKLIDFGIAKSIQGDTTNIERESQVGTLNYMSPEAFLMNERDEHGNVIKCGRSSDIWALGCILYQMVYGKTPFAHITSLHAKIQEVANPRHKINYLQVSNPHLLDIMKKCLAYNRDERLRIPELLNHPFLQPQLAQNALDRRITEEILREIQMEEQRGRDATALRKVLGRVKSLGC